MTGHRTPIHVVPLDLPGLLHARPGGLGHEDVLLRLALWLADVASEATLGVPPQAVAPRPGPAGEPPVVESAP